MWASCSMYRRGPSRGRPQEPARSGGRGKGGQAAPSATHLEEPVVVNHAVLRVEEGKQRVLGV